MAEGGSEMAMIGDKSPWWVFDESSESIGVIDILDAPVRWLHVQKTTARGEPGTESTTYYIDYVIPDPTLTPDFPKVKVKAVRKKSFPLVGGAVDVEWRGKDFGLGIVGRLDGDSSLRNTITQRNNDVEIRAYPDHECWLITESFSFQSPPTRELWDCYQTIARHLLAARL